VTLNGESSRMVPKDKIFPCSNLCLNDKPNGEAPKEIVSKPRAAEFLLGRHKFVGAQVESIALRTKDAVHVHVEACVHS